MKYNVKFKSNTHKRYLEMLDAIRDGVDVRAVKREIIDYLSVLIVEGLPKIQMKEAKALHKVESIEEMAYKLGSFVNFAIHNNVNLTRAADMLGKSVLLKTEDRRESTRKRSLTRVKSGIELLDLLRADKKISFRRERIDVLPEMLDKDVERVKGRAPYRIKILDEGFSLKLAIAFYYIDKEVPLFTQPLLSEPSDWDKFTHPVLGEMVRNLVEGAQREFSINKTPTIFNFMNKISKVSFRINQDLLAVYNECLDDSIFTNDDKDFQPIQLHSILMQQHQLLKTANSLKGNEFWLGSFLDFRGRFYYSNTYLHPQGNKLSRSLFLFSEGKPIGKQGWKAMLASAASEYGKDKWEFKKKVKFAKEHLDEWIPAAQDPLSHKDVWQSADNPFGFLSLIMEIEKALREEDKYLYVSAIPIFIDASNSGTQILSALGRDTVGGALSNLIESDVRGDVYQFIADKVWAGYEYTPAEEKLYKKVGTALMTLQAKMDIALRKKDWDKVEKLKKKTSKYYEAHKEDIKTSSKVFWSKLSPIMRKLCKRPTMTIPYSAGVRTIAKAIYKDWRPDPKLEGITSTYCFKLALDIVNSYKESLKIPTDIMDLFIKLGQRAHKQGKDLKFYAPYSKFPFIQNARKDKMEKMKFIRNGRQIELRVCVGKNDNVDINAVKSGSSPNSIHALDASLMLKIVMNAHYPMIAIHDSFATYPGEFEHLHCSTREMFVEMFEEDVLMSILRQCDSADLYETIERGELDIRGILRNSFAFDV